ncbi:hypothetical protein DAEQUDRAFT_711445 [Daedalea quercina L-15889]|uniref:C2H2-type domain-containing protein n=1 Tax=Daedalea quercina L-15889 TaxID=1314783 RepID=A0A165PVW4_9APHY|nr:hypothetical protein DAEQUDRAFT_711445 [Daedalea quercina L-15889]
MSFKRPRSGSSSQAQTEESAPSAEPTPKAVRTALPATATSAPLLCTLPPTCNPPQNRPTPLANSTELESHYATYHAHVCEEHECGCVFPDARLLELHQTECHDPIAAVRKDRGEKIFACHVASCSRRFLTPKARRLHLIQGHGYPKEYFFAVTNKGVGGLLKKWGEGASMMRGQWKPRDQDKIDEDSESEDDDTEAETADTDAQSADRLPIDEDTDEDAPPRQPDDAVQGLTGALDALSLVPSNVKFGRGGSMGGFRQALTHGKLVPGLLPARNGPLQRRGFGRGRGCARGGPSGGGVLGADVEGRQGEGQTSRVSGAALGAGVATRSARGFPHARVGIRGQPRGGRSRGS